MRENIRVAQSPRKRHSTKFLAYDAAVDLLHRHDARLVLMTSGDWFVLPSGGRLTPMVADRITRREDMIGAPDDMFPLLPRTWRRLR